MAKEKPAVHIESTPGRTVGWIVLILGIITLLFGAGRLLFVVSYGFVQEATTERFGYEPACVESATDVAADCEQVYAGMIEFGDGAGVTYSTPEEYAAAVDLLRAAQRNKSGLILVVGVATTAVGLALLAATHHDVHRTRPTRRRSSARA